MDDQEQTNKFAVALDKLINYYAEEYDLTYATMIGTLWLAIYKLSRAAFTQKDDT